MDQSPSQHLLDHLFRHQSGKMIAVLTRIFGLHNLQLAEDVIQEAFLKAVQTWKFNKLPDNPSAWLMQVAKNKAIDIIRKQQNFHNYSEEFAHHLENETENPLQQFFLDSEIEDSQLRMIFACCHPSLKEEDQIALTLKTASAFSTREIAKALLTNEETVQKRLSRARQFIKKNNIQFEIPAGKELIRRLEVVHAVLYLLFNEGYNSIKTDELIRRDLCAEAMRLSKLLTEHKSGKFPSSFALMALMCLHAARFDSRLDSNNSIILLEQQDRNKWSRDLINIGYYYLNLSADGDYLSVYHIESAIAAEHSTSRSFKETNWKRIVQLYDLLLQLKPSPIIQLNRAVALAETGQINEAITSILAIDKIKRLLVTQYIYSAVLGELYKRLSNAVQAKEYLQMAHDLTDSNAEKNLLEEKLKQVVWLDHRDPGNLN